MKTLLSLVFLILFNVQTAMAIGPYCAGDTLNCFALGGLKLRDAPKGKPIATVPLGGELKVISIKYDQQDTYEHILGHWIEVKFNDLTGYVFDGFLSKMPAPSLQDSSLSEYLERVGSKIGKPMMQTNECESGNVGESTYHVTIQLYQNDHFAAKQIDYTGWEWGHTTTVFDYASFEEIFLLCKALYREAMAKSSLPEDDSAGELSVQTQDESGYYNLRIKLVNELDRQIQVVEEGDY